MFDVIAGYTLRRLSAVFAMNTCVCARRSEMAEHAPASLVLALENRGQERVKKLTRRTELPCVDCGHEQRRAGCSTTSGD
jgi:hypothetical protein